MLLYNIQAQIAPAYSIFYAEYLCQQLLKDPYRFPGAGDNTVTRTTTQEISGSMPGLGQIALLSFSDYNYYLVIWL